MGLENRASAAARAAFDGRLKENSFNLIACGGEVVELKLAASSLIEGACGVDLRTERRERLISTTNGRRMIAMGKLAKKTGHSGGPCSPEAFRADAMNQAWVTAVYKTDLSDLTRNVKSRLQLMQGFRSESMLRLLILQESVRRA